MYVLSRMLDAFGLFCMESSHVTSGFQKESVWSLVRPCLCLHVCAVWLQCGCVKLSRLHVVVRFVDELPHIRRVCTSCLNSGELSLCLINRFAAFEAAFFTLLGLCSWWHLGTSVQFRK